MIVFQLITLPIVLLLFVRSAYRLFRGDRPRRGPVLGAVIWLAAGVAILRPDLTNIVAEWLGIGRGTDLLVYVLAILFFVSFLYMHQKHRKLESEITEIVRNLALRRSERDDAAD